jgi:hypothetical protein
MAEIECVCPARPDGQPRHPEGDTVTLRQSLGFTAALTVRNVIAILAPGAGIDDADILAALTEKYLYLGIESWTVVDAKGKPVPVTRAAIAEYLLSRPMVAKVVGDEADDLYTEAVVLPLLGRLSKSSPPMPTDELTSAPTPSPTPLRKRSRQSSITTSPTDAIGKISALPGGGSSYSQS